MTEERTKELSDWLRDESGLGIVVFDEDEGMVMDFIRTVAAEAREEGMEEMVEAVYLELGGDVDREFLEGIAAERLKEQGK